MTRARAAAVAALWLVAQAAAAASLTPIRITDRVYYFRGEPGVASSANEGFNSNAGFVITEAGVVVVDALGTPALGKAMIEAIGRITPLPVRRVIVTHYHADHFYGLQAFREAGAEVWAHAGAKEYFESGEAARRLEQRRRDLFPWVDEHTRLVRANRWLEGDDFFTLGGVRFRVQHLGPAHSPEDLIVVVPGEGVVFIGDLIFTGRIPFVGEADSKRWLERIDQLMAMRPKVMVSGHGQASRDPLRDLAFTRDYLVFLRAEMGKAVEALVPFDEAYAKADWSRFAAMPAFDAANRINAYGTYLLMEKEMLRR